MPLNAGQRSLPNQQTSIAFSTPREELATTQGSLSSDAGNYVPKAAWITSAVHARDEELIARGAKIARQMGQTAEGRAVHEEMMRVYRQGTDRGDKDKVRLLKLRISNLSSGMRAKGMVACAWVLF